MIWRCPLHQGALAREADKLIASCCGSHFPIIAGIPDLRVAKTAWIDVTEDRQRAEELAQAVPASDVAGSVQHVGDQAATVREVNRVLEGGSVLAVATPNRYSLAAEPHVGTWGVGFLPRVWQAPYVRRRTGLSYAFTRLLSAWELGVLPRTHSSLRGVVHAAAIPATEIERFGDRRRILAQMYNTLLPVWPFSSVARQVGPFFHLVAVKPADESRT